MTEPFTLQDLHDLALKWCPERATWIAHTSYVRHWGAAHEIGHAMLSLPGWRDLPGYGLCPIRSCVHRGNRCHDEELAAMRISHQLLMSAGHGNLSGDEYSDTDGIESLLTDKAVRASWKILRARHCWPLPRTRSGLERALERKLGQPNRRPIKRP